MRIYANMNITLYLHIIYITLFRYKHIFRYIHLDIRKSAINKHDNNIGVLMHLNQSYRNH